MCSSPFAQDCPRRNCQVDVLPDKIRSWTICKGQGGLIARPSRHLGPSGSSTRLQAEGGGENKAGWATFALQSTEYPYWFAVPVVGDTATLDQVGRAAYLNRLGRGGTWGFHGCKDQQLACIINTKWLHLWTRLAELSVSIKFKEDISPSTSVPVPQVLSICSIPMCKRVS